MHSRPRVPVTASFGTDQKERAAPGRRMAEEILRTFKVIADIVQRGGNVIIIPVSWALRGGPFDFNGGLCKSPPKYIEHMLLVKKNILQTS